MTNQLLLSILIVQLMRLFLAVRAERRQAGVLLAFARQWDRLVDRYLPDDSDDPTQIPIGLN